MDDISSFARTLTKLERLMTKINMAIPLMVWQPAVFPQAERLQ